MQFLNEVIMEGVGEDCRIFLFLYYVLQIPDRFNCGLKRNRILGYNVAEQRLKYLNFPFVFLFRDIHLYIFILPF